MAITHILSATTPDDPAYEIRPSHWNSAHAQLLTISGNTAGQSTYSGTNLVFEGGANATLSLNGNTLVFSGGAGAAGNTGYLSGGTTYASLGTVSFSNLNGISFGVNGQTITASHNALTTAMASNRGSDFVQATAAFAGTNASGTIASGGISVSVDNYITTGALSDHSHAASGGNGSFAFQTLSFSNANGISFGSSAGPAITASYTVPTQSNQTLGLYATGNTTQNSSSTFDARSVTFNAIGAVSMGYSNGSVQLSAPAISSLSATGRVSIASAGDTISIGAPHLAFSADASSTFSTLTFQNSNGVSFSNNAGAIRVTHDLAGTSTGFAGANISGSMTHNSAGLNLSLSVAAPGAAAENNWFTLLGNIAGNSSASGSTIGLQGGNNITVSGTNNSQIIISAANQTNQTVGVYHVGNTTGQSSSSTADARTISIDGAGIVSAGWSNGSIRISATQSNQAFSADASSTFQTLTFQNSNGISFSNNAGALRVTHDLAGTSTGFAGANISGSMTHNSAGLNLSLSVAAPGGGAVMSCFNNMDAWANSTTMQMLQSTSHVQPFILEAARSFAFLRIPMSISNAASSTGVTTGNSSWSYGHSRSHNFVIYSRGVGASSLSLQSVASTQLTDQQSIRVSAAAGNSTQFSYTNRATYQMSTGTVGFTHDYSSSAASLNFHTSGMTANTGLKMMEFPWATSLSAGDYWLAYGVSSSTASQYTAQGTRLFQIMSNYGMSQPNLAFGTIGAATNSSVGPYYGLGSFTTAGGGTTASMPISAVRTSGSHNKVFFQLCRIA